MMFPFSHQGEARSIDVHVGMRVRFYRRERGITPAEMERVLALPPGLLPFYEQGLRRFPIKFLNRLCSVYGVSLLYFFEGMPPKVVSAYSGV